MAANRKLLILPGDGIGPEVMGEVKRVVNWMDSHRAVSFDVDEDLVGGCAYDAHGAPLSDATMQKAMDADAVLLGAVGGPKWEKLPFAVQPERGLLRLRKDMELFANLRPALVFDALAEASTLKTDLVAGLDILIIRELTGGVYFGEPRGITDLPNGERRGVNTQVYDTHEIIRIGRIAFELARKRGGRVCSVEKANVMESGVLWREEITKLGAEEYADVELSHMYADNCAMQLVRAPKQFDVIVTDNLFGDILSDCAAMLTGSLGMLPSASLGAADATGRRKALYEPVHGSAPDIAGTGKANPLATILSYAMMLRYSFDLGDDADMLETAVKNVLNAGLRTPDIMQDGKTRVSTTDMGQAVVDEMAKLAG
jgi:3-isopropylmalate dehydrogenase